MKKHVVTLAVLSFVLVIAIPASAITDGEPDNGQHPFVGIAVFYSEDEEGNLVPEWRCSGTILAARVFLTAGHCTTDSEIIVVRAQVWFFETESELFAAGYPFAGGFLGTPFPHPAGPFSSFPDTHDVGIVLFDKKVPRQAHGGVYGKLAPLGSLDALATNRGQQEVVFTVVGYGLQEVRPDPSAVRTRLKATTMLVDLRSALTDGFNIHTSNDPGNGAKKGSNSGGTCFGDSGGPVFHGDFGSSDYEPILVGVTSFGLNLLCKGADFAYRTDIADTLDFLAEFGVTP